MINMSKFGRSENMLDRAASRVRLSSLERSRTYKAYRQHVKDAKDSKEVANDPIIESLRSDMQLAKDNYEAALIAYESIRVCPPLGT